ncbi:glycosyltransferase family 2 protein [Synechococcus sp. MIT S9452]|uniref:glycosyltransferase family 2 protein n=1 Tax=Synechococcus sp. MIT S9452 TaxID=3082546 RepID=UPI0039A607C6
MKSNRSKVAIVIPAYNESLTIYEVVSNVSVYGDPIVVNDGSTDDTSQVAQMAGAFVLSFNKNQGYDFALSAGIAKAIEQDFDYAITVDGDGQHNAEKINQFVEKLLNNCDLVVGVRDNLQRPAELIFSKFAQLLWRISDPLCGMKGYRLAKFKLFASLNSYQSIGTELTIRAIRSGWNIDEISIKTLVRQNQSRFGSGLYPNFLILKAMIIGFVKAKGLKC